MATTTPGLTPAQLNYAESEQWKQIIKQALADTRCASPAFLVDDMSDDQTVTVQIALQERVRQPAGQQWMDIPPIVNVPIMVPRGGGFSQTLPLKKGDQGMLIFCDTCFDNWWVNGQDNAPPAANVTTPSGSQRQLEIRRHYVHDCGFFPGLWSQNNLIEDYSTNSMQLRADDGSAYVDIASNVVTVSGADEVDLTAPTVHVSDGSGTPLALMNDNFYQYFVVSILPFLRSLTPPYVGPNPPLNSETTVLKGQ
jgi:hypothetical protein